MMENSYVFMALSNFSFWAEMLLFGNCLPLGTIHCLLLPLAFATSKLKVTFLACLGVRITGRFVLEREFYGNGRSSTIVSVEIIK